MRESSTETVSLPATTSRDVLTSILREGGFVELEYAGSTAGISCLVLDTGSNGSTIEGLAIGKFTAYGIEIHSNGNTITGNHIGTDAAGTAPDWGNTLGGVLISSASSNTIGGTGGGEPNLIIDNGVGVAIVGAGETDPDADTKDDLLLDTDRRELTSVNGGGVDSSNSVWTRPAVLAGDPHRRETPTRSMPRSSPPVLETSREVFKTLGHLGRLAKTSPNQIPLRPANCAGRLKC